VKQIITKLRFIAGLVISLLCMYLALRGANLSEVIGMVSTIKFVYLLPMTASLVFAFIIRAIRWQFLLAPVKVVSVGSLFASTMIGFMANNVLPFRAGEIVRGYSISRNENISLSSSLASLVVERLFDGVVISLFMLPLLLFIAFPPWLVSFNYLLLLIYVVLGGAAIFLIWARAKNYAWLAKQRWEQVVRNFTAGLEVCASGKQVIWIGILSLAHWLVIGLYYYLLFLACSFSLSFLAAIVLVVIVAIGIMLPAAPGYVGNFQYFTVLALSLFSISREEALGYSLIAHAGQFIPVTVIGLLYFFRQSIGFSELRRTEEQTV
jgi:glycosyltransferase 2 family protein